MQGVGLSKQAEQIRKSGWQGDIQKAVENSRAGLIQPHSRRGCTADVRVETLSPAPCLVSPQMRALAKLCQRRTPAALAHNRQVGCACARLTAGKVRTATYALHAVLQFAGAACWRPCGWLRLAAVSAATCCRRSAPLLCRLAEADGGPAAPPLWPAPPLAAVLMAAWLGCGLPGATAKATLAVIACHSRLLCSAVTARFHSMNARRHNGRSPASARPTAVGVPCRTPSRRRR